MPSLFKRKSVEEAEPEAQPEVVEEARPRGRTPSKRELGQQTKKRPSASPRRVDAPPVRKVCGGAARAVSAPGIESDDGPKLARLAEGT